MTGPVLLLFGPTAVGKTDTINSLLASFWSSEGQPSIEVISADSRQVYRGLDIGTAKPTPEERRRIPHHLIDVVDPSEPWDVGRFVEISEALIPEIVARGRLPVMSGGTAFYLQAFLCGLPGTPRASVEVRGELERRLRDEGLPALRAELRAVDPVSDDRIAANDGYRVVRALEVYRTAGRPLSSYQPPQTPRDGVDAQVVGLFRPRPDLYRRIDARVAAMFSRGLPEEVERLYGAGVEPDAPGMQTIGYREFFEVGGPPPWDTAVRDAIQERIARNTRRYAKRQETFFRKLPGVHWVHADDHDGVRAVLDMARKARHTVDSFLDDNPT